MEDAEMDLVMEVPDTPERLATNGYVGGRFVGKEGTSIVTEHFRNSGTTDKEYRRQLRNGAKVGIEDGHNRKLAVRPPRFSSYLNGGEHPRTSGAISSSENSRGSQQPQNNYSRRLHIHLPRTSSDSDGCEQPAKSITIPLSGNPHASKQQQQNGHIRRSQTHPAGKSCYFDESEYPKNSIAVMSSGKSQQQQQQQNVKKNLHIEREHPRNPIVILSPESSHGSKNSRFSRPQMVNTDTWDEPRDDIRAQHIDKGKSVVTKVPSKSSFCIKDNVLSEPNELNSDGNAFEMGFAAGASRYIHDENMRRGKIGANSASSLIGGPNSASVGSTSSRKGKEKAHECAHRGSGSVYHGAGVDTIGDSQNKNVKQVSLTSPSASSPGTRKRLVRNGCISPHNIAIKARHLAENSSTSPVNVNVGENDVNNEINRTDHADAGDLDVSRFVSASDLITGSTYMTKRQKARNHANCSRTVPRDCEVVSLVSPVASKNSQSHNSQTHYFEGVRNQVIEIDDVSPVIKNRNPENTDGVSDVHARAIQIEADEILARELQEQLYHEDLVVGGGQADEHLAWALQQEDGSRASRRHQVLRPRLPSTTRGHRLQSQPRQNNSYRRGSRSQNSSSSRMPQLRNRFRAQHSRLLLSRQSVPDFPSDMDLDMRLNILEAMEAAVGDLNGTRMDNRILRVQRDFNENDYEMLLALDENNHHVGVSASHIQGLPLSTVQSENFEDCAVCLETPAIGDTIRHLPCLHKFHKDCIDPWLSRNTSCPICKSSVT